MDAKIVWISAAVALVLSVFLYMTCKVAYRITSGKYPPTRHVVRFDEAQLQMIVGKIKNK